jgi:Cap4 SAVED domain
VFFVFYRSTSQIRSMANASWKDLINIDRTWVSKQLTHQFDHTETKIVLRVYTIKFSGNLCNSTSLIEGLVDFLKHFVHSKKKIEEIGAENAFRESLRFFGDTDPQSDGKYGELILFALVEATLGCKMVAHKIRVLTNFNDQVKGGDGIFLGDYSIEKDKSEQAFLIGESKIIGKRSDSIKSSLESLNRFHDMKNSPGYYTQEFIVAKENLLVDNDIDPETLYNLLSPTTEEFKKQVLVHPILLMFDSQQISKVEKEATSQTNAEKSLNDFINETKNKNRLKNYISTHLKQYPELEKTFLDFFILPIKDVNEFRNSFYYALHNTPYKKK